MKQFTKMGDQQKKEASIAQGQGGLHMPRSSRKKNKAGGGAFGNVPANSADIMKKFPGGFPGSLPGGFPGGFGGAPKKPPFM